MRSHTRNANSASPTAPNLEQEVARIVSLSKEELRALWRKTKGQGPPEALSKDLIARVLTEALQEARFGGLAPNLRKQLAALANGRSENARYVKTGSIIVREYQGQLYEVVVVPDGFLWEGQTYRSLSTIARKITGTTWNGPRFFGLRSKSESDSSDAKEQTPADKQLVSPGARSARIVRRSAGYPSSGSRNSKGIAEEGLHGEVGI